MIFDMLKRLHSVVYLPNDYVCKKVSGPKQPQRGLAFTAPWRWGNWAARGAFESPVRFVCPGRAELRERERRGCSSVHWSVGPRTLGCLSQGGFVRLRAWNSDMP